MTGPIIPRGRSLSEATCKEYAEQLIGCLQMWGISKADAWVIIREMTRITREKAGPWENPLEGSGMVADKAIEGGLSIASDGAKFADFKFPKIN